MPDQVDQPDGWTKSSLSGDDCVEIRHMESGVQVRHSADPEGPVLSFSDSEWHAFLAATERGEFRRP